MKRILSLILAGLMLLMITACSGEKTEIVQEEIPVEQIKMPETKEPEPEPEKQEEPVVSKHATTGEYVLFGVTNEGYLVKSEELEMESKIILEQDNTGTMTFNEDEGEITNWQIGEDTITITMYDGSVANGVIHKGIIDLDLYGDGSMILHFAQSDADISQYEFVSLEDVRKALSTN